MFSNIDICWGVGGGCGKTHRALLEAFSLLQIKYTTNGVDQKVDIGSIGQFKQINLYLEKYHFVLKISYLRIKKQYKII